MILLSTSPPDAILRKYEKCRKWHAKWPNSTVRMWPDQFDHFDQ